MKISSFFLFLSFTFFYSLNAQNLNFEWAKKTGGLNDDEGCSITTDIAGNVYMCGSFEGAIDINPLTGNTTLTSFGDLDIIIQKLDPNGNTIWVKQLGGISRDHGNNISIDPSGNLYITGYFSETCDFDPGTSIFNLTANGSTGHTDMFILKLNSDGDFIWAKQMGGTYNDEIRGLVTDNLGNVYTTGYFSETVDFDPGPGVTTFVTNGGQDIFIQKLNTNGDLIWAKQFGGTSGDSGYGVAIDLNDNVLITGYFNDVVDFDPGTGVFNLSAIGNSNGFIQKLDSNGDLLWVSQMDGDLNTGRFVITDDNNNVYTTGEFEGTIDFEPGSGVTNVTTLGFQDAFIQKLNSNGELVWVKQFGGDIAAFAISLGIDEANNLYLTGGFMGTIDFNPGLQVYNLSSNGNQDIFISKINSNGEFVWSEQFGSIGNDVGYSIKIDANGNVYSTGIFENTVDFEIGTGVTDLLAVGSFDMYILKLSQPNFVGLTSEIINSEFTIYPNPTDGIFTIKNENLIDKIEIEILDTKGTLVGVSNHLNSEYINIDLKGKPGVYFVKIKSEDFTRTKKLIKK